MSIENKNEYCQCDGQLTVYTSNGEWGYWDMCANCDKPLEDGFHYYSEEENDY